MHLLHLDVPINVTNVKLFYLFSYEGLSILEQWVAGQQVVDEKPRPIVQEMDKMPIKNKTIPLLSALPKGNLRHRKMQKNKKWLLFFSLLLLFT